MASVQLKARTIMLREQVIERLKKTPGNIVPEGYMRSLMKRSLQEDDDSFAIDLLAMDERKWIKRLIRIRRVGKQNYRLVFGARVAREYFRRFKHRPVRPSRELS